MIVWKFQDFLKEKDYVIVKKYGKVHKDSVTQIAFVEEMGLLITSSLDPETSVILKHTDHKNDTICYRMAHVSMVSPTNLKFYLSLNCRELEALASVQRVKFL